MEFAKEVLRLDPETEIQRICEFIKEQVLRRYRRRGVVVGISGGIDSALLTALCVRALGVESVLGLILPERESSPKSMPYAQEQAKALGVRTEHIDMTPILSSLGVYERKDEAIRAVCPDYDPSQDRTGMSLPPNILEQPRMSVFSLTVEKPSGSSQSFRLGPDVFRAIYAAQNIKQRARMIQLYYHAERNHYIVGGTTNRSEMEQGFFVKHGDGGVDLEPMAHLYKTQIFQLARHLGVIEKILNRAPSPDTWSGEIGDEEFYFRMPFDILDLLLYAWTNSVPVDEICRVLALTEEQVHRAFQDFESKKRATWHLRCTPPSIVE